MYIHEIGKEKKNRYHASLVCVRFSRGGGGGRGWGETTSFVSKKNISIYG